jgi:hypothetical protein
MKKLLDTLLSRCVNENEIETRLQVARCFGEIGAISANRFDDSAVDSHQTNGTSRSRLDPPWYSTPRDQYLLVLTNHLVPALTAGTKALDQNKIAFAIQQVLSLLNIATKSDTERRRKAGVQSRKRNSSAQQSGRADSEDSTNEMDSVLVDSLVSAQIFDVVEPFWSSKFREVSLNIDVRVCFDLTVNAVSPSLR